MTATTTAASTERCRLHTLTYVLLHWLLTS